MQTVTLMHLLMLTVIEMQMQILLKEKLMHLVKLMQRLKLMEKLMQTVM